MLVILAGFVGSALTVMIAYVIYLRGRVSQATKDAESLRGMIKLFTERTIVAALSDDQMRYVVAEMCQAVSLAVASLADPERLDN